MLFLTDGRIKYVSDALMFLIISLIIAMTGKKFYIVSAVYEREKKIHLV